MLGIVIGVVAIASMGILGNSLVLTVSDSLKTVGDSVIFTPHVGGTMRGFGGWRRWSLDKPEDLRSTVSAD